MPRFNTFDYTIIIVNSLSAHTKEVFKDFWCKNPNSPKIHNRRFLLLEHIFMYSPFL